MPVASLAARSRRTNPGSPAVSPAMTPTPAIAIGSRPCAGCGYSRITKSLSSEPLGATHSSAIKCALLPPNPKFEIAARRGPSLSQASSSARSRKPWASIASSGSSQGVGGSTFSSKELKTFRRLATPDAVIGCPIFPFREPMTGFGASAHTLASDSSSTVSPRGVPVA